MTSQHVLQFGFTRTSLRLARFTVLVVLMALPTAHASDVQLKGETDCAWGSKDCNRCAPRVEANFNAIEDSHTGTRGSRMHVRSFAYPSKDALLHRINTWKGYEHIQGIGRIAGLGQSEYLVFTHSTRSSQSGKNGALAVVRIGANQGSKGLALGDLQGRDGTDPRRHNRTVARTFSDSNHPGGLATLGHYVFVADWCQPHGEYSWCAGPDQTAIEVYDVSMVDRNIQALNSNPPERIVDQSVHVAGDVLRERGTASIAATRLADKRYLVALGRSGGRNIEYFVSNDTRLSRESRFESLGDVTPIAKWGENSAIVNECGTGDVYLIQLEKWDNSRDQAHLFKLKQAGIGQPIEHHYVRSRTFKCSDGTPWCDFDKGAGVYLSPAGYMYLYASDAEQDEGDGTFRMVEFANAMEPGAPDPDGRPKKTRRDDTVDHRQPGPDQPRRNEKVPSKRGEVMPAPSELTLSEIGQTSLRLNWMDNSTSEFGIEVERGTPVSERGGTNYGFKRVFNVEERVMDRVRARGWRTDVDDQLDPGTEYCYRVRAYEGTTRRYSSYSPVACARTGS